MTQKLHELEKERHPGGVLVLHDKIISHNSPQLLVLVQKFVFILVLLNLAVSIKIFFMVVA